MWLSQLDVSDLALKCDRWPSGAMSLYRTRKIGGGFRGSPPGPHQGVRESPNMGPVEVVKSEAKFAGILMH